MLAFFASCRGKLTAAADYYDAENLIKNDETVNNYEIPIRIAYVLGFTEESFPVSRMAA